MKHPPCLWIAFGGVLCLAALAAGGCGGGSVKPHGTLMMNGQPYKPESGETLQITFAGEGESGKSISAVASVNPDGTFTVSGSTNTGIPPGKYRIMVQSTQYSKGGPMNMADKFQGKYSDATKTPLTCEITSANQPIIIDVGKGTASTGT